MKVFKPIIAIVAFLGTQLIGGIIAGLLLPMYNLDASTLSADAVAWITIISGITSVLIITLALKMIRPKEAFLPKGLTNKKNLFSCSIGILGAIFGIVGTNFLSEQINLPNLMEEQFLDMSKSLIGIVSIAIAAPIVEELIFREGIEGHLLRIGSKPWMAICFSALAFGAIHMNPAQVPFAFIIGIILGILYWRTGNVILCCLLHFINNSVAIYEMNTLGEASKDISYSEMVGGNGMAWTCIIVSAIVSAVLLLAFCKMYKPAKTRTEIIPSN